MRRALWALLAFGFMSDEDFGVEQRQGMTYVLEGPLAAGQGAS